MTESTEKPVEAVAPVEAAAPAPAKKKKKIFKITYTHGFGYAREAYLLCKAFYPAVFTSSNARPHAIGIFEAILKDAEEKGYADITEKVLKAAFEHLSRKDKYHQAVIDGTHRFNLDGSLAQEITAGEKTYSRFAMRFNRTARAKRKSALAAKAAAEAKLVDAVASEVAEDMPAA